MREENFNCMYQGKCFWYKFFKGHADCPEEARNGNLRACDYYLYNEIKKQHPEEDDFSIWIMAHIARLDESIVNPHKPTSERK